MIDGSFREKFHSLDFFCNQTFPKDQYELNWIEYYSDINHELKTKASRYPNCNIITLENQDPYHSSYCFNEGIKVSKGELLVIPDADVIVEEDFLEKVWHEHQQNSRLAMYIYRYNEPQKEHSPDIDLSRLKNVCKLTNPSNYGGCLTVRKKWLLSINGYEQHPIYSSGFHANGLDIYTRLKVIGLNIMWHPELKLFHPWHPFTLANDESYKYQKIIVDYRAKNLLSSSFIGIDPKKNSNLPKDLAQEIDLKKEAFKKDSLSSYSPKKSLFQKLFRRI